MTQTINYAPTNLWILSRTFTLTVLPGLIKKSSPVTDPLQFLNRLCYRKYRRIFWKVPISQVIKNTIVSSLRINSIKASDTHGNRTDSVNRELVKKRQQYKQNEAFRETKLCWRKQNQKWMVALEENMLINITPLGATHFEVKHITKISSLNRSTKFSLFLAGSMPHYQNFKMNISQQVQISDMILVKASSYY